jgi:hypothetical protein
MTQRKKTPHQGLEDGSLDIDSKSARGGRAHDGDAEKARSDLTRQVKEETELPQKGAP